MVNLDAIGKALVQEVKKEIVRMGLIDLGNYLNSIGYKISGTKITLFSTVDYAEALEFGTYDFGRLTAEKFPDTAQQAKSLKKKDLPPEAAKALPKGMVAFAPFRRVVYNKRLVESIILNNSI